MEILGYYEIRDSGFGYDEITFAEEQDISDKSIDLVNAKILKDFNLTEDDLGRLDWRDPNTLWIWQE